MYASVPCVMPVMPCVFPPKRCTTNKETESSTVCVSFCFFYDF